MPLFLIACAASGEVRNFRSELAPDDQPGCLLDLRLEFVGNAPFREQT